MSVGRTARYVGGALFTATIYYLVISLISRTDQPALERVVGALCFGLLMQALKMREDDRRKRGVAPYHPGLILGLGIVGLGVCAWCWLADSPQMTGWALAGEILMTGSSIYGVVAGVRGLQYRAARANAGVE